MAKQEHAGVSVEMGADDYVMIRFAEAYASHQNGFNEAIIVRGQIIVSVGNLEAARTLRDALSAFITFHERFPPPGTPEQIARQFDQFSEAS